MKEFEVSSERGGRKVRGHESPSVITTKYFCRIVYIINREDNALNISYVMVAQRDMERIER